MASHAEKVEAVARQLRSRPRDGSPADFAKRSVSHFVPNPFKGKNELPPIDLRPLNELIEIDEDRGVAVAESGVTFSELVRATLPLGWVPSTVPELEGITIGGAVSGCSVESMSYRYGGFHDSCLVYEVITGAGEVLTCSREKDPELFEMLHGSYGTLGILSQLTFQLRPAKPFVRLDYVHFDDFGDYWRYLRERCAAADFDFVDGIIHAPDHLVVCLGTMVDETPYLSSYRWLNVYYRSTAERRLDYLTTYDYLFRYDTECHWMTRTVPFLETRPARLLLGKLLLGSENMITWSHRLKAIYRLQRRPDLVVDVFIPSKRFEEFFRWYVEVFDFWPLWIVPYRMPHAYPWVADAHQRRMGELFMIDCAIYGKPNQDPDIDYSEILEKKTYELGGVKTLISRNHHDRETFWTIYDRPRWSAVKERTDPDNVFGDLYDRMHPRSAR